MIHRIITWFPTFGGVLRATLVGQSRVPRDCLSHQYNGLESSFIISGTGIRHPNSETGHLEGHSLTVFENTFMMITPAMISPIPRMAGKSGTCLYRKMPAIATSTTPTPHQIAYATSRCMLFTTTDR